MQMTQIASASLSLHVVPDRAEVAVVLAGELDLHSAHVLETQVAELRDAGFDRIVVDLSDVCLIDSSGLRVLITLRNAARRRRHGLELVPAPADTQRVFDLTATRALFDWRAPRRAAS